jgi:monovalent cation:H+ antiporter, CPA1 family
VPLDIELAIQLLLVALAVALVTKHTKRPYTIALVIWGLILGLLQLIEPAHLSKDLVLTLFLPPLLFEGALHIRSKVLRRRAGPVVGLALAGTLLTAFAIGAAAHWLLGFDWLTGLLLGAIIAPTDPVSVLATFRAAAVDRDLSTIVESESLFNDGIAVVIYVVLLDALGGAPLDPVEGLGSFVLVIGGGLALGLGLGMLVARLLERLEDHLVQVMLTLVLVYGAFLLAEHLHLSGVIAVAVAGLAVGNQGLRPAPASSRERVGLFWEIVAFLVNSVVFLLIGFELQPDQLLGDLVAIGLVFAVLMLTRAAIVYGLGGLAHWRQGNLPWRWRHVILWGGLRGAVPVALALGLPPGLTGRDTLVHVIFGVVLISLLGQGLTMPLLLRKLGLSRATQAENRQKSETGTEQGGSIQAEKTHVA